MPTPVTIARQCLAPEAVHALDEAVSVAHRRCHAQTSSLHAVSALLSLPSSPLREACVRSRNSAYASRVQFKALELCLGVALDRLSSTAQRVDEPPVSNSLMAAIKRSQANQRRQQENFHLYQQMTSSSPSSGCVSTVKVEIQNLILSILDDPVVSRVFGESGFRSSDIKLSILRPVHRQLLRGRGQPIFVFPFQGYLETNGIHNRINEILVKKPGKTRTNPLLVGPAAAETVRILVESLQKTRMRAFSYTPTEITNVISIKHMIMNQNLLGLKIEEVGNILKQSVGSGVMVEFGELNSLLDESVTDSVKVVVKKLGELVASHGARVWLIGSAENHETCIQFFNKFPSVEHEWDLHVLPIRPAMPETFPKSSLMESFVPFGGFFSLPSDISSPLRISNHFGSLCHICDDKFKLEVNDISKGVLTASVSDHHRSSLPSWLHSSQICEMDAVQAQDDPAVVSAKIFGLQKKWHNICQRLHQGEPYMQIFPKSTYTVGPRVPSVVGFQVNESTNQIARSSTESGCDTVSNSKKGKDPCVVCSLSGSTASGNSVTTDLGVGPFDQKDSKLVYNLLLTRVGRQEEAFGGVSQTIARCRARPGHNRAGIWFGFVGPDKAGKKKTAVALAEVLLGGRENIICVDLSCCDFLNGCDRKLRGKNIVDYIADELIKKPLSVVFLENADVADTLTQQHLSRAASTGRFSDSHGREVSISNAIFVLTSTLFGVNESEDADVEYTEETVLKAKCGHIRALSWFDLDDMKPTRKVVRVTRNQNKRKDYLDLNLPAEEREADFGFTPENSNAWLEEVLQHVDEKVIFKPFDFDSLAEKILKRIGDCFENNIGLDCSLEIDYKVMEQILKVSWFLEPMKTDDWIEQVLGEAFTEARNKYGLGCHSVLKLVTAEEQFLGIQLPDRILMS
ncbi:protein SMAX1-LIKE 6-like [Bidens hawaiensis]|uniref:protein SMAX1-LIKE 6-like n=1 Tax=Bidens hawaiensis TaxID=980011 RepID=UPI00404AF6D9